jgi:selenocysteine lyase/cysteine desulfurase
MRQPEPTTLPFLGSARPAAPHDAALGRSLRECFIGVEKEVVLFGGDRRTYVNLDNAATTPAFTDVAEGVGEFLEWYASVHRGTGAKAYVSTRAYEACRGIVRDFVGADADHHEVIFTSGATDSINRLAATLARDEQPTVIVSGMEHHSNILPWRRHARVEWANVGDDGALDLNHLEEQLRRFSGRVRLVAVTGASNVTGLVPPLKRIARMAHEHGAELLVDAAQLVAHRTIRMGAPDDPERIDFLVFSAHKMYAPFGAGALIGPRAAFEGEPAFPGGGTVELVMPHRVVWAEPPDREEPGTPNAVGVVALARACRALDEIGMERVAAHDEALRARAATALAAVPGIRFYGEEAPETFRHVGVLSFDTEAMPHGLLAAILGYEWGIGVRHGCFCAHPYLLRLLKVDACQAEKYIARAEAHDHADFPGLVRLSFGLYNTAAEVDYTVETIRRVLEEGPRARYFQERRTGDYVPLDGAGRLDDCFQP